MKFILELENGCPNKETGVMEYSIGKVYGGFADGQDVQRVIDRIFWIDPRRAVLVVDGILSRPMPSPKMRPVEKKRQPGDFANFGFDHQGEWICKDCGSLAEESGVSMQIEESAREFKCVSVRILVCPNCDLLPHECREPIVPKNIPATWPTQA